METETIIWIAVAAVVVILIIALIVAMSSRNKKRSRGADQRGQRGSRDTQHGETRRPQTGASATDTQRRGAQSGHGKTTEVKPGRSGRGGGRDRDGDGRPDGGRRP